jgi:hypothetical protein
VFLFCESTTLCFLCRWHWSLLGWELHPRHEINQAKRPCAGGNSLFSRPTLLWEMHSVSSSHLSTSSRATPSTPSAIRDELPCPV